MTIVPNDALHERGRALEDEFFHRVDQQLLEKMREQHDRDRHRQAIIDCTGLPDGPLIDHLVDHGFSPSSLAALMLFPAVLVAWADGKVEPAERQAILHECLVEPLASNPAAKHILEHWLQKEPPKDLWALWDEYAQATYEHIGPEKASRLAQSVRELATKVGNAAGGLLGRGKISQAEQEILDRL